MRTKLVRAGLLTLLLLPNPVSAFSFPDPLGIFGEKFDGKRARVECEEKGKLVSKGPIEALGYLLTINNSALLFQYPDIAKELLSKRFQYLEINQEYRTDTSTKEVYRHDRGKVEKHATGTGTKFIRFFLFRRGDPSCAGFEEEIKEHPSLKQPFLREAGLPRDLCIAAERIDSPQSTYELNVDMTQKYDSGVYVSYHYKITNRQTGELHAEVTFPWFSGRNSFTCPNGAEVKAISDDVLKAVPNPALPPPNRVVYDDDPPDFPLVEELSAKLVEESAINIRMKEADFQSALRPIAEEGEVSLSPRYGPKPVGDTGFQGSYLIISRDGITRQVLVRVRGRKFSDFRQAGIQGGNITFVAIARSMDPEWWLFQYSLEGRPLKAYRLLLPQLTPPDKFRLIVRDLLLTNEKLSFTLLAWVDDGFKTLVKDNRLEASLLGDR